MNAIPEAIESEIVRALRSKHIVFTRVREDLSVAWIREILVSGKVAYREYESGEWQDGEGHKLFLTQEREKKG